MTTLPYKVTITKPGLRYQIEIGHGLLSIGRCFMGADIGWWAWTRKGAERKAARIVLRDRADHAGKHPVKEYTL